jgi:hypothetical protein
MSDDNVTPDEAHEVLADAYGGLVTDKGEAVIDLAGLHDAANSFLNLYDSHTDDEGTLPEDLDAETKRQLKTADTVLRKAVAGLDETAADRLAEFETEVKANERTPN